MNPCVLVVDDEDALAITLEYNLGKEGFAVGRAADGDEAVALAEARTPDVIVLDWMLPKMNGLEVCRTLRERKATRRTPILMLTARGAEEDKLAGLTAGADDYVVKPFGMSELVARLRALLRRARPEFFEERLEAGDVILDQAGRRVTRAGKPVKLGPTEFRLLEFLMRTPGRVFSRERLKAAVWGEDIHVEDRTVDAHMGRLRRALRLPRKPDLIRTVRSAGYALDIRT